MCLSQSKHHINMFGDYYYFFFALLCLRICNVKVIVGCPFCQSLYSEYRLYTTEIKQIIIIIDKLIFHAGIFLFRLCPLTFTCLFYSLQIIPKVLHPKSSPIITNQYRMINCKQKQGKTNIVRFMRRMWIADI